MAVHQDLSVDAMCNHTVSDRISLHVQRIRLVHSCWNVCRHADKKPRRVKKPHHLDEFESGFDDEMETPGLPRRSTIDRKRRLPIIEARYAL